MAKVQLRDVRKSYIHDEVIHGVSIDVVDGEFIVSSALPDAASPRCCAWWPGSRQ